MQIIRATQKVLKELGLKGTIPENEVVPIAPLGPWYANLLRFDRRKCILFTQSETLYSFMVLGVKKKDFQNLQLTFSTGLETNLRAEGLPQAIIDKIQKQNETIEITRTKSRSVLGSMNDHAYGYEVYIDMEGGVNNCNILEINKKINRTPMGAIGYNYAIEKLHEKFNIKRHRTN